MKRAIGIKILGIITLFYAAVNLWLFFYVMPRFSMRIENSGSVRFLFFELLIITTGIGLLYRRKWAALLFSTALTIAALWLTIFSILYLPWGHRSIFDDFPQGHIQRFNRVGRVDSLPDFRREREHRDDSHPILLPASDDLRCDLTRGAIGDIAYVLLWNCLDMLPR